TSETRGDDAGYHEGRAGGIKDDPELARYYANLEVPYGSDLATVTRAWKALLKRYHPDKHSTDPEKQRVANDLVQQLNHAYEQLRRHLQK
ncbi:MAG: J domain-containing protein, partial [Calditrichaeota bacterium]|nr:J domain-containing protein [Calditrichota bacterium]